MTAGPGKARGGAAPEGAAAEAGAAERIRAVEARGEEWVVLEEVRDGDRFRRVELHVPTGVAVTYGTAEDEAGRRVYFTESAFRNRRTGGELPCGSRAWNVGVYRTREELEAAVAAARADVYRRFPAMIEIYRRRRGAGEDRTPA